MPGLEGAGLVVKSDVVIFGGGIAGTLAAIRAAEVGARVVLVEKATVGLSGCSAFAAGVWPHWDPEIEPDIEPLIHDIVVNNCGYLADVRWVEKASRKGYELLNLLIDWGVEFERDQKGHLLKLPIQACRYGRCTPFKGGWHMMWKIRAKALEKGVTFVERVCITDLIVEDGRVAGAVGFHTRSGQFQIFLAKATINAAGGIVLGSPTATVTGEGQIMALRAGAKLRNVDMFGAWSGGSPRGMDSAVHHVSFGSGVKLLNALGEDVMKKHFKDVMGRPGRAILMENLEGNGPVCFDATGLDPARLLSIKTALPVWTRILAAEGKDIARDKIEFVAWPSTSYMHGPGIKCDHDGYTGLPGFYAAGSAGDPGTGIVDSTTAACLSGHGALGWFAGEAAANYASTVDLPNVSEPLIERLKKNTFAPMAEGRDMDSDGLLVRLRRTWAQHLWLIRNERRLKEGQRLLSEMVEHDLPRLRARDAHELRKVHEVAGSVMLTEIACRGALMRKETRGYGPLVYREDYPFTDNENWLKWIVASMNPDGEVSLTPTPLSDEEMRWRPGREENAK